MDYRQIRGLASALYAVAIAVGFIFGPAKVGVLVAVVGAVVVSLIYTFTRAAGPVEGGRNRNRDRKRNRS